MINGIGGVAGRAVGNNVYDRQERACETSKPIREVSPVESALDMLNSSIETAMAEAQDLVARLGPVSDIGGQTAASEGGRSPAASPVESRIADASHGVYALIDLIRSARLGLRI